MCIAWLMTFLGCGKEKPHMLDGPGMEYQSPWTAFTISGTDSNTKHSFCFTVTDSADAALVSGECSDETGKTYSQEQGVNISDEDVWKLRWMNLDQLPDKERSEDQALPADMAGVTLSLTLSDGTVTEKIASGDLSMEIYQLLLPYFKK